MACPFCATGQAGLTRNLSTGEIVEQVVGAARTLGGIVASEDVATEDAAADADGSGLTATDDRRPLGSRVSNVVFMGMGEPLANYRAVSAALRRLIDPAPEGLGLSQRAITVSTVGLVPGILKLQEEKLQVTLALSLHAPDDELRDTLVPINQRYPVAEVLDTAFGYARATGRRLSIEYALMRGINDQPERADLLAARLRERGRRLVHVNLIPLNPTPGSPWTASTPAAEREFVRRLRDAGVNTTVRDTRGREIAGACGQLAAAG
jgi:23S rRNA (adenine2503-C2)-methyltransferase